MTPEYWTALRLRFTVEGPNGERQVDTDKPYAVLGITEAGELVCGDGDGEAARQHSLVVASDAGIFACMLRDDMPACPYEFQDGEAFPIGSQQVYLNRIGEAEQPKPFPLTLGYLAFFKERKQIGARRVLGPLTVVGRERPAKWRFKSGSIAPCHLGIYSDGDRAWAISLHRDNPVRIFGEPVATAALDLEHPAQFGNYRLLYFSNANAARIDDKRELTDKELYGPQHGAEFSSPTNSGSLDLETVGQSDEVTLTDPLMSGGLEYDELDGSSEDGEGGGDAEGSEQSDIQLSDPTWSVVDQQDDTDESPEPAPPAMNADYVALQHELADVRGMIEAVHTDLAEKSQQERSAAADHEAIASSQQTVRAEIEALRADFQQRQAAAETHADELDALFQPLRTELADLRNALAAEQAAPREQVEQLSAETHDRVDELQSELAKVQAELTRIQAEQAAPREQVEQLSAETQDRVGELQSELANVQNELTRIQAEQASPREQVEQLSAETQDRVGELQSELAKVQNELTRIQAEQQRSDQAAAESWREDLAALERQVSELLAAREQDAAALAEQTDKQAVTSLAAIESLRDELQLVRADVEQLPGEVPEDWREHVDQLRNEVLQLQAEAESREENTSLQSVDEQQSTKLFQQEVKSLGDQLAQLREELRELRDSQENRQPDAGSDDALAALQDQVDSLQAAVKRQERREEAQAKSAEADELPELRQELLETNRRLQSLSDSVRDLESNGDTEAEHAASELKEQLAALAEQVTASQSMLQTREADTENALNTLREQVGELQGQSVDSQGEQQAAVETLRKEFATLQEQLAEIRSAQQADAGAVAEREKQYKLAVDALEQRATTLEDQVQQGQAELARASDGQADTSALRADVKQIQDELKLQDEVATEQAGSQAEALQAFGRQLEGLRAELNTLQTSVREAEQGMVQLANEQRQSSAGWKQGLESAQAQLQTEVERFQQEQQDQRDQQDQQEVQRGQTCASCESLRQEVAELRESLEAIKEAEAERQRCAVESAGHRGAEPSATTIEPELVLETAAPSANTSLTVGAEATEQLRATRSDNDGAIVVTDDSDVIDMDEVAGVDAMDGAREADSVDGGSDGGSSTPDAPFVSLDGADAAVRTMEVLQRQNAERRGMMGKALASWPIILWVGAITGLVGLVTAIVWRFVS